MMDAERLACLMGRFNSLRLVVLGDYFLDKYLDIDRSLAEISLETGLEAHQVVRVRVSPGAGGNVASNLAALGVQVLGLTILGDDGQGYDLGRQLEQRGIDTQAIIRSAERFTPTYMKPLFQEPDGRIHEGSRMDIKNRSPLPIALERTLISRLGGLIAEADGLIVCDQVQERNCGVVTDGVRAALRELTAQYQKVMIADSRTRVGEYGGMMLKPNDREAVWGAFGSSAEEVTLEQAEAAGLALSQRSGHPVFVTVGERGILVCHAGESRRIPAVPVRGEIDIVGAGDSALAGIAAALAAGANPVEAAVVGNLVASVTIRQIGTTGTASQSQVLQALEEWRR